MTISFAVLVSALNRCEICMGVAGCALFQAGFCRMSDNRGSVNAHLNSLKSHELFNKNQGTGRFRRRRISNDGTDSADT
jgi:hypothetical protein